MSNKSKNPKSKKQRVEPVPSLTLDMGAIRAATVGIKHDREAVERSQQQERLANNEYKRREKKGQLCQYIHPIQFGYLLPSN